MARLKRLHGKKAQELIEPFEQAIAEGDLSLLTPMQACAMAETEVLRRQAVDSIQDKGIIVRDEVIDALGNVIGTRERAHPMMTHVETLNEQLGHTANHLMISKKSRGEGAVNAATAVLQARRAMLLGADKSRLPPPPPDDDEEEQQTPPD